MVVQKKLRPVLTIMMGICLSMVLLAKSSMLPVDTHRGRGGGHYVVQPRAGKSDRAVFYEIFQADQNAYS